MIEAHLLKLRKRDSISAEEEAAIRGAFGEPRHAPADRVFIREGQELSESTLLIDGWMARAKDLRGGERQLSEVHVAGDFVDLHSFTLKRLDHDIIALTPCTVVGVPHQKLKEITERHPHLTRVFWFSTNLDAALHRERTLSLGRRSALSRVAHLICEMHVRLEIVGLTNGDSYEFPVTQVELGECMGMTAVHANRTLQELRRRELITLRDRRLTILDMQGLKEVAEFDPGYLYLECKSR
jgi:CRP-like cAMP-binding protein